VDLPGTTIVVDPARYLTTRQLSELPTRPDMILQFAQFLATLHRNNGDSLLGVRVRAFISLNGRPACLLVDSTADLAREHRRLGPAAWIVPASPACSP
jgi:vitamin K-dependent gamma-carboxylase